MDHSSTASPPGGAASDPLIRAFDSLDTALRRYAAWPWSRSRRDAVIIALNTVLVLHLDAVARATADLLARIETQQGRHELRLDRLERRGTESREASA